MVDKDVAIERIDKVLTIYGDLRRRAKYDDLSDLHRDGDLENFMTRALATITAIAEPGSTYVKQSAKCAHSGFIPNLVGVLQALRSDLEDGYLWNMRELIHADVFSDFMEMARYLLEEGYKDPAAVLVGGVLEGHLRQLANKNTIDLVDASGKFKKAGLLNDELRKATVYLELDHKNVLAWLELRNKAAHGKYSEYGKDQVNLCLAGVRDFITRVPA